MQTHNDSTQTPSSLLTQAKEFMKALEYEKAINAYEKLLSFDDFHLAAQLGKSRAELKLGRVYQVQTALKKLCSTYPEEPEVWMLSANCQNLLADHYAERKTLRKVLALKPLHLSAIKRLLTLLHAEKEVGEAKRVIKTFIDAGGNRIDIAQFEAMLDEVDGNFERALLTWKELEQKEGQNSKTAIIGKCRSLVELAKFDSLSETYLSFKQNSPFRTAVLELIVNLPDEKVAPYFSSDTFEAHYINNPSCERAFRVYRQRLRIFSSQEALFSALTNHGLQNTPQLPLKEAIASIGNTRKYITPNAKLYRFWHLCGKPFNQFEEWLLRANWYHLATKKVDQKLMYPVGEMIDVISEVRDISESPEYSLLDQALESGKGCLVAGSHIGPTRAFTVLLDSHFQKFRVVGGYPVSRATGDGDDIFMRNNLLNGYKKIVTCLKNNEVIACAPDSVHENDPKHFFKSSFGAIPVQISYASIIYRTQCPSFWAGNYWKDEKIVTILRKLPSPQSNERKHDFIKRWCEEYLSNQDDLVKNYLPCRKYAYTINKHTNN